MKRLALNVLIALTSLAAGCQQTAHAASLRGAFWVAVAHNCVAQASDGISTALAISAGAHEINPFLVHSSGPHDGQLDMPRAIAFKAVMCALPVGIKHLAQHQANERTGYVAGAGFAGSVGAATQAIAVHNFGVWTAQKALNAARIRAEAGK